MQYFFILGHNPTLSVAEIISILPDRKNEFQVHELSEKVLMLEIRKNLDYQNLQERLGGTIKIGKIISIPIRINAIFDANIIREICGELVKISERSKKVYFGFSLYKLDEKINLNHFQTEIKNFALEIKRKLKEGNISSRWVESKELALSSVIVQKNKLLTSGAEFVFLIGQDKIYLGRTLTCQKFEEYEFYDFARPKRKIEKGMIPPKLAKIMINFAFEGRTLLEGATLLDPFCGSGTIIQEAVLLGYQRIIGSDVNSEAVEDAKRNLEWFAAKIKDKKQKIKNTIKNLKIFQSDVRDLSQKIAKNSVDAIVTEPYLGPIKIKNLEYNRIKNIVDELSALYLESFRELKKILKPDGKIVIVFPVFKIENQLRFLPILDELKKYDWKIINPIPPELRSNPIIKITPRNSIIYSRPNQTVLREIFILKNV